MQAAQALSRPERIAIDLALTRELIAKIDGERGVTDNPLMAAPEEAEAANGHAGGMAFRVLRI